MALPHQTARLGLRRRGCRPGDSRGSAAGVARSAPEGQVGRVMSLVSLVSFTALPVSVAAIGPLVAWTSVTAPFIAGGSLILAGGLLALLRREVTGLRL